MSSEHDHESHDVIDVGRRKFLVGLTTLLGGIGALFASVPFIGSWWPSEKAESAAAPVEVDLHNLQPGEQMTVEWRGKPVWIIRRTHEDILRLAPHEKNLRDPDSHVEEQQPSYVDRHHRGIKEKYLILVGVCTHLGCSPLYKPYLQELAAKWPGGFICPCHGSKFDLAGRVYKGVPAPINLLVPPHTFISEDVVVIGQESAGKSI
jgi:ubiquinol-cytochrome c reductase iron-sulfur subunit